MRVAFGLFGKVCAAVLFFVVIFSHIGAIASVNDLYTSPPKDLRGNFTYDDVVLAPVKALAVDAGPDQMVCVDDNVTMDASAIDYIALNWTSSGDGTFSDNTSLTAVYYPGPIDEAAGSVNLTLTAEGNGHQTVSDQLTVTLIPHAIMYAGVDGVVCEQTSHTLSTATASQYATIYWTSSGTGTFSDIYALNPVYTPSVADVASGSATLTLHGTNQAPCTGEVVDPMILTIRSNPTANAGGNDAVCDNISAYSLSGANATSYGSVAWETTGSGTFSSLTIVNPVYNPSAADLAAGAVTLTLVAYPESPCGERAISAMTLSFEPSPLIDAGSDVTSCGDVVISVTDATGGLYSSLAWSSSGDGSFSNTTTLNTTYTPGVADIANGAVNLSLTATGQGGCTETVTDNKIITIRRNPSVDAGSDQNICESGILVINSATASDYNTLSWTSSGSGSFTNESTLTPTYTPSASDLAAGTVTLTLTATAQSPCVTSTADQMNLAFETLPTVDAGPSGTICSNEPTFMLNGSATDYSSVLWTTSGSGSFANDDALSTAYSPSAADFILGSVTLTLTVNGENGCSAETASDVLTLALLDAPEANAGPDAGVCNGNSHTINGSSADNYSSLLWTSSGDGAFTNASSLTPTYTPGTADQSGGTVTLTLTAYPIDPCTNSTTDAMVLTVMSEPAVNVGADLESCGTTGVSLNNANAQNYSTLSWTSSGTGSFSNNTILNPVYSPSAADLVAGSVNLTLLANANSPCTGSDSDVLTLDLAGEPTAYAGADAEICEGEGYTVNDADATFSSVIAWTTSGDGTLTNADSENPTYVPGTNDINDGSVTLTMTVTGTDPCTGTETDQLILSVSPAPESNAGANADICESDTYATNGAVTNSTSYYWTTSGTGSFANANILSTVYTPSAADITTGSVTLTLTAEGLGGCTDVTSSLLLTIYSEPVADAGADFTSCEGAIQLVNASAQNAASVTWSTSGDGTFVDNTQENPVYVTGSNDVASGLVILTMTTNPNTPCTTTDTDQVNITIEPEPDVSAGADVTICETTASYILSGASASGGTSYLWTTNGSGNFTDATLINATYLPSAGDISNGGVVLTLTATRVPCTPVSDAMTLTINSEPEVNAGDNASVCNGSSYTLNTASADHYSSVIWTTSGSGSLVDGSIVNATYNPSAADYAAGSVVLTLTAQPNNPCSGSVFDIMTLSFQDEPTADAGAGGLICENSIFTVTDAVASNHANVSWSTSGDGTFTDGNTLVPTYTPGANDIVWGSATLTLTAQPISPCAVAATSSTTVNIQVLPTINAGNDESICEGGSLSLATASASDYVSITWTSTGSGSFDNTSLQNPIYTPSAADISSGNVTLTLTGTSINPCTGTISDDMVLTIVSNSVVDAGSDVAICENESYFINDASATSYGTISWNTSGDGTFSNPNIIDPTYTPGPNDITGGSATLTLSGTSISPCSTTATDQKVLTIDPLPVVFAGDDATICLGSFYTASTASATNYSSVQWTSSGTGSFTNANIVNAVYTPSTDDINAGSVTLTLTANGTSECLGELISDDVVLSIYYDPTVDAGPDLNICDDGINITTASAENFSTLLWTSSGSSGTLTNETTLFPTYIPDAADIAAGSVTLTLTAQPQSPCTTVEVDQVVITINPSPVANAGDDAIICEDDNFIVSTASAQNESSVSWSTSGTGSWLNNGTLTPTYIPSADDVTNGSVILTLTTEATVPCTVPDTDQMVLTIQSKADVEAGNDETICNGDIYTTNFASVSNYDALSWTSSGAGTFDDNSLLHTTYTPALADLANGFVTLTLTASNTSPCLGTESDQITISFQVPPSVDAGSDGTICENGNFIVTDANASDYSSLLWTSSGNGTFVNGTSLTPTYVPGSADIAAGSVTLTLTAQPESPCSVSAFDQITLTVDPMPTVNAGSDGSVCEGNSFIITDAGASDYTSFTWSTTGSGTFDNGNTLTPTYIPVAADYIAGSVVIRLTASAVSPCSGTVYDEMTLNMVVLPEASAGDDEFICDNEYLDITTATAQDYSSVIWTSSGSGSFSDASNVNPIYYPSAADVASGSVTLTLTAVSNTPCASNISDDMVLSIELAPVSNAGTDGDVCETGTFTVTDASAENYQSIAWSTTGTGTLINANTLSPSYTPSATDVLSGSVTLEMTVTGIALCSNSTDEMVISIIENPVVDAGADATSCADGNYQIVNVNATDYTGLQWTTSGTGVFSNENILMPAYIPSAADLTDGSVTLTLTATPTSPCTSNGNDSFILRFQETASINAGSDEVICAGEQIIVNTADGANYAEIQWTTNGSGGFISGNTLSPTYIPSAGDVVNGSVILTLTATGIAPCGDVSDDMTLTIQGLPTAFAGSDASICENQTYTVNDASATNYNTATWATTGSGTFVNGSTLNPTYTPSAADVANGSVVLTITVDATTPCVGVAASNMTLSFVELPTATAGADATVCEGSDYINTDASADNYSSLLWTSNGSGTFTDPTLLNTTYQPSYADFVNGSVTLTMTVLSGDPCNANQSDEVVITLIPEPVINAGDDESICENETLTVSSATANYYNNIYWSTSGDGSFSGGASLTPVYTPGSGDIANGSVVLTLNGEGEAPCSANMTDEMVLTIVSDPTVDAGSDANICYGESYTITDADADDYATIAWTSSGSGVLVNPNTLTPEYIPSAADLANGTVTLTLTATPVSPCATTITDVAIITISANPQVDAGTDDAICETDTYTLINASASDYISLLWTSAGDGTFNNDGNLNAVYTPGTTDITNGSVLLTLTATGIDPCTSTVSDNLLLTINPEPTVSAGPDLDVCEGSFTINTANATNYNTINWSSNGSGVLTNASTLTPTYTASAADLANGSVTLSVSVTGIGACSASVNDEVVLTYHELAESFAGNDGSICETESFTTTSAIATNFANILWTTSGDGTFTAANAVLTAYDPGANDIANGTVVLTLTAEAQAPCTSTVSDDMILTIEKQPTVYAGGDESQCNTTFTINDATATHYNTVQWFSSGSGLLTGSGTLTPSYTPSVTDINNGSVTFTLIATGVGACTGQVQDSKVVTFSDVVTADAGSDANICQGETYTITDSDSENYVSVTWSSSGTGTFEDVSTLAPTYTPSVADIASGNVILTLTATGAAPCNGSATSDMLLTITAQPFTYAGVDAGIAASDTYTVPDASATNYASLFWETSGTGTFIDDNTLTPTYTPSADDIAAGQVMLTIHATPNAPCVDEATDILILTIGEEPTAYAGSDDLICETDIFTVSGSSATNYSSLLWTSSGTGLLTNVNTLYPTYDPSNDDITAGFVILTLTATGIPPVTTTVSDEMILSFHEMPNIDAGADASTCDNENYIINGATASGYSTLYWTTSGSGIFSDNTQLISIYSPSLEDAVNGSVVLTLHAVGQNPCTDEVTDNFTLTVNPSVDVYAGVDVTICEGGTVTINTATATNYNNLVWTHNGSGSLSNASTLNPTYSPDPVDYITGTVNLTLTGTGNAPCILPESDEMTITFSDVPTVYAGADTAVCIGEDLYLGDATANNYSSLMWSTTGTGIFNSTTILNPTYMPSAADEIAGSVTLTLTVIGNATCPGVFVDQVDLNINELPDADAGDNITVCPGEVVNITTATASNYAELSWSSNGTGTFINGNTISPTYIPSSDDNQAGTVIITLIASALPPCTSDVSDAMILTIQSGALVNAGEDAAICEGMNYTITDATAFNYTSFSWSHTGGGTLVNSNTLSPTYIPVAADYALGTVVITLTAEGGVPCTDPVSDNLVLSLYETPTVNAGPDETICETDSFSATAATATDFSSLEWTSTGTGSFTDATLLNTTYVPSVADIAAGSVILTLQAQPMAPCLNVASDQLVLNFMPQPLAYAGDDDEVCEGENYTITTATAENYSSLIWSTSGDGTFINNGTTNPTYIPGTTDITNGSASLTLVVNGIAPCIQVATDQMLLDIINHPTIYSGADATICEDESYTLGDATAVNYSSIEWSTSGTGTFSDNNILNPIYNPSAADIASGSVILTLRANDVTPCNGFVEDDMVLNLQSLPQVYAGDDSSVCEGSDFSITTSSITDYNTLTWTTSGTGTFNDNSILNPVYSPSADDITAGQIIITVVVDAVGPCSGNYSDSFVLDIIDQPIASAGVDATICSSDDFSLITASASDYSAITWTTSGTGTFDDATALNPIYTPSVADAAMGTIVLTITTDGNVPCTVQATDDMTLTINQAPDVSAGPDVDICEGQSYSLINATANHYVNILWTSNGNGTFDDATLVNPVYTPSADDILNANVILTITVTGNPPCPGPVVDEMVLNIIHQPEANAGSDLASCEASVDITGATASNYASLTWSSSGTGFFSAPGDLLTNYNPTAADIAAGSVTLTLTAAAISPCVTTTSDDLVLTLVEAPVVDAGGNDAICEGETYTLNAIASNYTSITWTTNGTGTFINETTLSPTYIPSADDYASGGVVLSIDVDGIAPCGNANSSMILTFIANPVVDAGDDVTICEGDLLTITDASADNYSTLNWTTSGSGTFINGNTLSPTYTASADDILNGTLVLTLEATGLTGCNTTIVDSKTLMITGAATVYAGADADVCEDDIYIILDAVATNYSSISWSSSGDGTFSDVDVLHPVYIPGLNDLQAGSAVLTIQVEGIGLCGSLSDDLVLNFVDLPEVYAGDDQATCDGGTAVIAGATASNYSTLLWTSSGTGTLTDENTLTPSYVPSSADQAAGFVTLTLTASPQTPCFPQASDDLELIIKLPSLVDAGPDDVTCEDLAYQLINATGSNYDSLSWTTNGTGSFSDIHDFTPNYYPSADDAIAGGVTLTLTVYNLPCSITSDEMFLTIDPAPDVNAGPDQAVCETNAFQIDQASASNYASLQWSTAGSGSFIDNTVINPVYTPSIDDFNNGFVVLTLTAQPNPPCADPVSDSFILNVNYTPVVDAGQDTLICINDTYTVSDASAQNYSAVIWSTSGDGSFTNQNTLSPSYQPGVNDMAAGNVILTLTASNPPCSDVSDQLSLSFVPLPVVYAGVDAVVAPGLNYELVTASASSVDSVLWQTGGSGVFDDNKSINPIYSPSAFDIAQGSVELNITGWGDSHCNAVTDVMTLVISPDGNPFPVDFQNSSACVNTPVHFTIDLNVTDIGAIAAYDWDFGDGNTSTLMEPSNIYGTSGTYTVTLIATDTTGLQSVVSNLVDVNELPVAQFGFDMPACSDSFVQFHDYSNTPSGYITTWHWDFGDGSDTLVNFPDSPDVGHVYDLDMNYLVTLTVETSDGCIDNITLPIEINAAPIALYTYSDTCQYQAVSFESQSVTNGGGELIAWYWNFDDPQSGINNTADGENVSHVFTDPGTYNVELVVVNTGGCSDTLVQSVTVLQAPEVEYAWTTSCVNDMVQFSVDDVVTNINEVVSWHWDFGDGTQSFEQNPGHVYAAIGTYEVTLQIINIYGCSSSVSHYVTITPETTAVFEYSAPTCYDQPVQFTYIDNPGSPYIVEWTWDFGDGNVQTVVFPDDPNLEHIYSNPGTYNVSLHVINVNGCESTHDELVIVQPTPEANFSYGLTCEDSEVFFTDLSQGNAAGQITHYAWDFGDPVSGVNNFSDLQHPSHIFETPGDYTVTLNVTAINGCEHIKDTVLTISQAPFVDFSYVSSCLDDITEFNSSNFVDQAAIASWEWNFGDGGTSSEVDPDYIYGIAGEYLVSLTVTDTAGCSSSVDKLLQVNDAPSAAFTYEGNPCAFQQIQFVDESFAPEAIQQWSWDFGDGTHITINHPNQPNITHIYTQSGTYNVILSIVTQNGCESEFEQTISINDSPTALVDYEQGCLGSATQFEGDALLNGGSAVWLWTWNFGDPASGVNNNSNLQNPGHIYNEPGTYEVCLIVENVDGCSDTTCITVNINPAIEIVSSVPATACLGDTTYFQLDTDAMDMDAIALVEWNMGNGIVLPGESVNYVYENSGSYDVVLSITDTAECVISQTYPLNVLEGPTVQFISSSACEYNYTQFTDQSFIPGGGPIVAWSWDFGDANATPEDNTSDQQHPTHIYTQTGTYTVKLVAYSIHGCADSVTSEVTVNQRPLAEFSYDTTSCQNGLVYFQDLSTTPNVAVVQWEWMFEDGQYSDLQHPSYIYSEVDSCYTVQLVVTDLSGCSDTVFHEVCVPQGFGMDFTNTSVCFGDETEFDDFIISPQGAEIYSISWDFGDPMSGADNFSTLHDPSHLYTQPGSYAVTMEATDLDNCSISISHIITVHTIPEPEFTWENPVCDSDINVFDHSVINNSQIQTWIWSWGDGAANDTVNLPDNPNISHTYNNEGTYNVTLTTVSDNGCEASVSMDVVRDPCLSAGFGFTSIDSCSNSIIEFTDNSQHPGFIDEWHWDFGDGNQMIYNDYLPLVEHTFENGGDYSVSLAVSGVFEGNLLQDTIVMDVNIQARPVAIFTADSVCFGLNSLIIDQSDDQGDEIVSWNWNFDHADIPDQNIQNPLDINYPETGYYDIKLEVMNENGCKDLVIMSHRVLELPSVEIEHSISCTGDPIFFTPLVDLGDGDEIDQYLWDFGTSEAEIDISADELPEYIYENTGNYTVKLNIVDDKGCMADTSIVIDVNPKPEAAFSLMPDYNNRQNNILLINVSDDIDPPVEWEIVYPNGSVLSADTSILHVEDLNQDGDYQISLFVQNVYSCVDTMIMNHEHMFRTLFVPNALAPDYPDQGVQTFLPKGLNLEHYNIQIFNLEGNKVWESNELDGDGSPKEGWDGTYHGIKLPMGLYVWKISAVFKDGTIWNGTVVGDHEQSSGSTEGTLLLIR